MLVVVVALCDRDRKKKEKQNQISIFWHQHVFFFPFFFLSHVPTSYKKIIAVCLVCVTLLRIFYYVKRKWLLNGPAPSGKYILSRVGCKVDDLELKINILTYKLQYGTWPLPHQIPNSMLKKQHRNLRLTLSTSNSDRKDWIRRILLG